MRKTVVITLFVFAAALSATANANDFYPLLRLDAGPFPIYAWANATAEAEGDDAHGDRERDSGAQSYVDVDEIAAYSGRTAEANVTDAHAKMQVDIAVQFPGGVNVGSTTTLANLQLSSNIQMINENYDEYAYTKTDGNVAGAGKGEFQVQANPSRPPSAQPIAYGLLRVLVNGQQDLDVFKENELTSRLSMGGPHNLRAVHTGAAGWHITGNYGVFDNDNDVDVTWPTNISNTKMVFPAAEVEVGSVIEAEVGMNDSLQQIIDGLGSSTAHWGLGAGAVFAVL